MPRRALCVAFLFSALLAQQEPRIDPDGVPGARIIVGGGKIPPAVRQRFVDLAGGTAAKIVLLQGASASADDAAERQKLLDSWQQTFPTATFTSLHTRDRAEADTEAFVQPLQAATGVWFGGGQQKRLADAYLGTRVERELYTLLLRGGVVGGTSAGAAIQSHTMIESGNPVPVVSQGFDFVPRAILDQHFLKRNRLPRLLAALGSHPGHFGIGIDESTAVEIHGRTIEGLGDSKALLVLAPGGGRDQRIVELAQGQRADLVTWQRCARDRSGAPWPPTPMATPKLGAGALVIVGGGRIPKAVLDRFVALAGGPKAKVVLVPTAIGEATPAEDPFARLLRDAGVDDIHTFHCPRPGAMTDEQLLLLRSATAIWFGGGRQWRLCDAYEGTPALAEFHAVLARGGVIGGSSAGATIQGEFLVRGNPLGNTDEWCEGYDRGFAFLPGVAIDQHFVARHRTEDLQGLVAQLPQLVGLGIDEGTAAIVQGSKLEVLGDSTIAVFDARKQAAPAAAPVQPTWLQPGESWDLTAGARAAAGASVAR